MQRLQVLQQVYMTWTNVKRYETTSKYKKYVQDRSEEWFSQLSQNLSDGMNFVLNYADLNCPRATPPLEGGSSSSCPGLGEGQARSFSRSVDQASSAPGSADWAARRNLSLGKARVTWRQLSLGKLGAGVGQSLSVGRGLSTHRRGQFWPRLWPMDPYLREKVRKIWLLVSC